MLSLDKYPDIFIFIFLPSEDWKNGIVVEATLIIKVTLIFFLLKRSNCVE